MKKLSIAMLVAVLTAALVATVALAAFINGNFEAGDFTGWTGPLNSPISPETIFLNTGLTGVEPFGWTSVARGAGGANLSATVTSGLDPNTNNALNMLHNGTYAARVNSQDSWSGASHAQNANSIRQTFTVDSGDVQQDGSIHLAFAYAPVMVDPGHSASGQPYFFVGVRNLTTGKTLYEVFSLVNQAGYPWVQGAAFSADNWYYMPWQEVDLVSTVANPKMSVGDSIEIEVIAAGCAPGGHPGYVYVDDFGFVIPSGCSPTLSTIAPISGPIAGGTQVTISGTNLNTVTALYVGTTSILPAAFVSQSATSIVFNAPAGPAGYTNVTVVNPCGSASFFNGYQYIANAAPVAAADTYSTPANVTLTVPALTGVLANDTDGDADPLTAIKVTDPASGTISAFGIDGSFTFVPAVGFVGDATFTYKANDGLADSNVATVTIHVTNTAPVAVNDAYSTAEDTTLTVPALTGVLANDTDADADPLTAVKVTDPASGVLTLNSDGSFTFVPAALFVGDATFTYKANDGAADSNVATVTITVPQTYVTISGNAAGKPGVTLTYNDGGVKTVMTDQQGKYTITVPKGWSGDVTPSKPNYADFYIPVKKTYVGILVNQVAQNYGAQVTFRPSLPSMDGYVQESAFNSKVGGFAFLNKTSFSVGDDAQNRRYYGILNFWTGILPDVPVNVIDLTLKLKLDKVVGTSPFTYTNQASIAIAMKKGNFGAPGLEITDFEALPTVAVAGSFNKIPTAGWYKGAFYLAGKNNVNMAGNTQLRLKFDLNKANATADYVSFFTGKAQVSADRPYLIIKYLMP